MKKRRIAGVAALAMASFGLVISSSHLTAPKIYADEITDKKEDISNLEKQKQDMADTLADLEKKKDNTLAYIEELDAKLTELETEIDKLDGEIETLNAQLATTKEELAAAKKKQEDQYNAMKSRIKYNYENGSQSYLKLLFESDSVVDFLNNALYAKEMAEFDQNMYDDYKEAKELVQSKEEELEDQLAELKDLKATQVYEKKSVEKLYAKKNAELEQYNSDIEKSEEEIKKYSTAISQSEAELDKLIEEAQKKAMEEEAARKAAEEAAKAAAKEKEEAANNSDDSDSSDDTSTDTGTTYSGVGYIWPCPASHTITSNFGPRTSPTAGASSYHKGIDIGAASGSTIVAAKGGIVVIAKYSTTAGNYVMISHGDGIFTTYMHASELLVSVGDTVNQGDAIAKVGSTGVSTGPHLHFAVTVDGTYVNPLSFVS